MKARQRDITGLRQHMRAIRTKVRTAIRQIRRRVYVVGYAPMMLTGVSRRISNGTLYHQTRCYNVPSLFGTYWVTLDRIREVVT